MEFGFNCQCVVVNVPQCSLLCGYAIAYLHNDIFRTDIIRYMTDYNLFKFIYSQNEILGTRLSTQPNTVLLQTTCHVDALVTAMTQTRSQSSVQI